MVDCDHCGEQCVTKIEFNDLSFCCHGCKTVYEILNSNDLGEYYNLEQKPGIKIISENSSVNYDFLNDPEIAKDFISYNDSALTKVTFDAPQIHCSSCIWLLENLSRLNPEIRYSSVNFNKKTISITYNSKLPLSKLVDLLASIGYPPDLSSKDLKNVESRNSIFYKIGIAGFCFGNIMLLAFPEYLGLDESFSHFRDFFGYISLFLSIPILLYSGIDYIKSALKGIRQRHINMDIPITLGILTLWIRSTYEIISGIGMGYLDSLAGLIFFLLVGKWFQQKTYDALSFDRNYKSYFPIAVNKVENGKSNPIKIEHLKKGDVIEFRNNELVPADGILEDQNTKLDYSFVTGESDPINKKQGDTIYAGGKILGGKVRIRLSKKVDNSYLTQLWNESAFEEKEELSELSHYISKYFTIGILFITAITAIYWSFYDSTVIWNAVTAVLIVACPCALALSIPFTFGAIMRNMGTHGMYIKNTQVIERLSKINSIVLDKTGTITFKNSSLVQYVGKELSSDEIIAIKTLSENSMHPNSVAITNSLANIALTELSDFQEVQGAGISAHVQGKTIKLGSSEYLGIPNKNDTSIGATVHLSIDGAYFGTYHIKQRYRSGLKKLITRLKSKFSITLLSGDNDQQKDYIKETFNIESLHFNQKPIEKLEFIRQLQNDAQHVLMIGDGLNDAGAIKQSDVGIAISDDLHQFSPACDAILEASNLEELPMFLKLTEKAITIVKISFGLSLIYNLFGIYFAVSGQLSPVIAAILMPLSSITIAVFTTLSASIATRRLFKT